MSVLSYKVDVIADSSGQFSSNAQRFATHNEAANSACALFSRWTAVRHFRITETNDPVNYHHVNGRDVRIEPEHDLQVNAVLDNKGKLTP